MPGIYVTDKYVLQECIQSLLCFGILILILTTKKPTCDIKESQNESQRGVTQHSAATLNF